MMGVEYGDFWELSPRTLTSFVKAFQRKREYDDELLWKQGLYFTASIASALSKDSEYPKQPYGFKVEATEEEKQEELNSRILAQIEVINSRF